MTFFCFDSSRHQMTVAWLENSGWTGRPRTDVATVEEEFNRFNRENIPIALDTILFVSELDGLLLKSDITDVHGMSDLRVDVASALQPVLNEYRRLLAIWNEPISPLCSYVDGSGTLWVGASGRCRFSLGADEWWYAGDCIEDALEWYRVGMMPEQWRATSQLC